MIPAARVQATIDLLEKIQNGNSPADAILSDYFRGHRYIGSSDRREISANVYEILRNHIKLISAFEQVSPDSKISQRLLYILNAVVFAGRSSLEIMEIFSGQMHCPKPLSFEEMQFLKAIEEFDVNSLPDYARANVPEFLYKRLRDFFGDTFSEEMDALNAFAPLDIRVNILKSSPEQIKLILESKNIPFAQTEQSPYGFRLSSRRPLGNDTIWKQGFIEVQDEGSQLIAILCAASPGLRVMDYCAGAGGKSLALSMLMENKGNIVACDVYDWRLKRAKQRAKKAGCFNIEYRPIHDNEKWLKRQKEKFDRVLVDVPCSGTGTWRRNPDLKWRFTQHDLDEVKQKQKDILYKTSEYVKPGGWIIYSTCSLLPEENREQIESFLETHPEFLELSIKDVWSDCLEAPYPGGSEKSLQLTPYRSGTDGFFVCVMQKREA